MTNLRLNQSRIKAFLSCRLMYQLRYVENLVPKMSSAKPLQVGDFVHRLIHKWIKGELRSADILALPDDLQKVYKYNEEIDSVENAYEVARLISGYVDKYQDDNLDWIPGETIMELALAESITLCGRTDAWVRTKDGRLWRGEHKTTAKMDSHYLNGLRGGLQGAVYDMLSENLFKERLAGTVYNLLVKTKVPQFHRAYTKINRPAIKRALQTIYGVARDIRAGDFYPSSNCFSYARECEYRAICEVDSRETRQSFYEQRTPDYVDDPGIKEVKWDGKEKVGEDV